MKPAASFVALSAALTGFRGVDLWGTGQVDVYLGELIATVGEDVAARLLKAGDDALGSSDPTKALKALIANAELGPVAKNVIVLWYTGAWRPLPNALAIAIVNSPTGPHPRTATARPARSWVEVANTALPKGSCRHAISGGSFERSLRQTTEAGMAA